ncbi:hypothetical protein [Parasitella parasitica]|uniref:Uncharacterized protein n=1 Tax=Parasitella parasitica TaxID=35722 RepID=A0A0B7MVK9_9FUNG|nr:hypothetical protein [Parasitella parasitica]
MASSTSKSRRSVSPSRHRLRRSPSPHNRNRRRHDSRSRSPRRGESSRRHRESSKRNSSRSPDDSKRSRHRSSRKSERRSSRRSHSVSSASSSSSFSSSSHERKRREHKKHRKDKKHKKTKVSDKINSYLCALTRKCPQKKSKKSKSSSIGDEWGKYGIIHEADLFTKEAEFQAWLIEVKRANVETLNNNKRKEMFVDFMEDYNTATMPHEKFYNLQQWERRQEAIRMGEKPMPTGDFFDFQNDEEKLKMQHRQAARAAASRQPTLTLSEEQIKELTRVNRERVEADRMRKMGLKPKESMGVRYEEENE